MKVTYNLKGIILSRNFFRERDSKLMFYSVEKGLMELIVRGTFKLDSKLSGHIDPISFCSIMVVRGKQFNYAGSVSCENAYANIKDDYLKTLIAARAFRIFLKEIEEGEKDENVFHLLKDFLDFLNNNQSNDFDLFYYFFLFKLLDKLGYSPQLDFQVEQENKFKYFDLRNSLILDRKIDNFSLKISTDLINLLSLVKKKSFHDLFLYNFKLGDVKNLKKIISLFYEYNFS